MSILLRQHLVTHHGLGPHRLRLRPVLASFPYPALDRLRPPPPAARVHCVITSTMPCTSQPRMIMTTRLTTATPKHRRALADRDSRHAWRAHAGTPTTHLIIVKMPLAAFGRRLCAACLALLVSMRTIPPILVLRIPLLVFAVRCALKPRPFLACHTQGVEQVSQARGR